MCNRGRELPDRFDTVRMCQLHLQLREASPVKNAQGKIAGASKIARDITEQKRSQERIATLAREA
jgi:hypothetical protein